MNDVQIDSRNKKRSLIPRALELKSKNEFSAQFLIHGLNVGFSYDNIEMKNWVERILNSYNVLETTNHSSSEPLDFCVSWQSPFGVSESELSHWNEDPISDLEISRHSNCEVAIQRDFMGIAKNEKLISVYVRPNLDDGFYNALRWLMPKFLLRKDCIVMHSSCFVGQGDRAHMFIGPSGVGKTTTVSRIKDRLILGDDMILITIENSTAFAETPILGQNPKFKGRAGKKFPINGFYFLEQAGDLEKTRLSGVAAMRRFFMSLMYPNWTHVSHQEVQKLTQLTERFLATVPSWNLKLNLNTPFLGVVDGND
ncbi:MAG: phosphoenolpyruvate carboxykinase (ATP) [Pseudomonadota bacterium]|nr:phosphoenolpyruvate carboxykinase (ATP) [Pseudomonadota bacterium]